MLFSEFTRLNTLQSSKKHQLGQKPVAGGASRITLYPTVALKRTLVRRKLSTAYINVRAWRPNTKAGFATPDFALTV